MSDLLQLREVFGYPPDECRIMVRWWWFGPAVTREEVAREMRQMKDAGIGGFEIQPVYPLALDDPARGLLNLTYLSDEFLETMRFAARLARDLGLRMDVTLGSGWPLGGPDVGLEHAAGTIRVEQVSVCSGERTVPAPRLNDGEGIIAAFVGKGDDAHLEPKTIKELPWIPGQLVELPGDEEGIRRVLFFISSRTKQKVKRPAVGAEGYVLDYYNEDALRRYLATVGHKMLGAGSGDIHALFHDSFEVFDSDWTGDFLEQFKRLRGYSLRPYLPALVTGIGDATPKVRHDYGQTHTELFEERFLIPLQKWCRRNRVVLRVQMYGTAPVVLSSQGLIDLPEGEGARWNNFTASRWASSGSHCYGKRVTSGEVWTGLREIPFRATPLDLKSAADQFLLAGVNQIIGHGWPYSPPQVGEPGWYFYAAGAISPHNPWWPVMPDFAVYLQRISFMLRQGEPSNDIALYLPTHDAWSDVRADKPDQVTMWLPISKRIGASLIPLILSAGYNFDMIDDRVINRVAKLKEGNLVVSGVSYKVVILPGIENIPLDTMRKLYEFARTGGTLIATRQLPESAPGLTGSSDSANVQHLVRKVFGGKPPLGIFFEREDPTLIEELWTRLAPDVRLVPQVPDVGFVHRRLPFADIYFLVNTANRRLKTEATFRVKARTAEFWDPCTGTASRVALSKNLEHSRFDLDLEPYGSRLIVLSQDQGKQAGPTRPERLMAELDLSNNWLVTFEESNQTVKMQTLKSWTDYSESQHYSGSARYERSMLIPKEWLRNGTRFLLNLGEPSPAAGESVGGAALLEGPVREAAEVFLNDRSAGRVWKPPYELDVSRFLNEDANFICVRVWNLRINQMVASLRQQDNSSLVARYGARFPPLDLTGIHPLPSGLFGPIKLRIYSQVPE